MSHLVMFMIIYYQYFICQSLIFPILKLPIHANKSLYMYDYTVMCKNTT